MSAGVPGRNGDLTSGATAHDITFFDPPALDRVLGVVMELAAQLNEERYRRQALEQVLARKGLLAEPELDALADDDGFVTMARAELARTVARLIEPIVSDGHPWRPLRDHTA